MSNYEFAGLVALGVALGKLVADFAMAWIVAWRMTHQRNKQLDKLAEIEEAMRQSSSAMSQMLDGPSTNEEDPDELFE